MASAKEQVIELVSSLPDDSTLEDIQYHLYVRDRVARGLQDVEEGRTMTQAEAEQEIKQWLKSYGPLPQ